MDTSDFLKGLTKQELLNKAAKHKLFFENDFSKLWVIRKIEEKILAENYLQELISKQLSKESRHLIKEIIAKDAVIKRNYSNRAIREVKKNLIIIEKDGELLLPENLKDKLSKLTSSQKKQKKSEKKKKKVKQRKKTLPFFFYHLLALGELKKNSQLDSQQKKQKLLSFLTEINTTVFSSERLYELIVEYARKTKIVKEDNLELTGNLNYWLKESYKQKLLNLIKIFFPEYNKILRQIIAVLSKYPPQKKISNSFLRNELNIQPFTKEQEKLLSFFNLLNFSTNKLELTEFCWQIFNKEYQFIQPEISDDLIVVTEKINLNLLWFIIKQSSLEEIGEEIKFKFDQKEQFLKEYKTIMQ